MTKNELIEIVNDHSKPVPIECVPAALQLFRADAYKNKCELIEVFSSFVRRVPVSTEQFSAQDYHTINQMYIQNALNYGLINNEQLGALYIRNIDYYTSMNATAEAIRYVNLVLDMDELPNIFYMAAISFMITLVKDSTARKEAQPYIEKYLSYFENNDMDKNTYFIMRMNLLEGYLKLDMRKEFFAEVDYFEKLMTDQDRPYAINMAKLLILAGKIVLSDNPVTKKQVQEFIQICENIGDDIEIISSLMGFLGPLLTKLRGNISDEALTRSLLILIKSTRSESDKVALYEYLVGRLRIDRNLYPEIYDEYFYILRRYYSTITTFSFQEAMTEIRFNKARKFANHAARREGMSSFSELYISMHLFNLTKDTFEALKSTQYMNLKKEPVSGDNANARLHQVMETICVPEDVKDTLEFCNIATLDDRMKNVNTLTHEFKSIVSGWCRASFIAVTRNKKRQVLEVIYTIEPIEKQKAREERLKYLSETDWLTGIKNRGMGEATIQNYLLNQVYGMLCIIDVDNFKGINDKYGHALGDNVIRSIAEAINKSFKGKDLVFRLGGDEFAAFAVGATSKESGQKIIKRLFNAINQITVEGLTNEKISISVGASFFISDSDTDFESLYEKADAGTYKSKTIEGNSCTYID